ncbi:MAG: VOC family protein [Proteobacteria bacterium]|nr:VOC family protein [Pseudomonadota bacterium]
MTGSVITMDIDHVGVAGRDIDVLLKAYEALGFKLTHPEPLIGIDKDGKAVPMGQVSAHFMFRDRYVELTAVTGEKADNHLEPWLALYDGLLILALAAQDADSVRATLIRITWNPGPIQIAGREVCYGRGGSARFAWFGFPPGTFPEAFVCIIEQRTPEIVFQTEMTDHPNGAVDLVGVYMVSKNPAAAAERYRPFEALDAHRFLDVMGLGEAQERFPGVALSAEDNYLLGIKVRVKGLRALREILEQASVPYMADGKLIRIAP